MSYQVGFACYADLQAAGVAACSQFQPVTSLSNGGSSVTTVSCDSSGTSGELYLKTTTAPVGGGTTTFAYVYMPPTYQPCLYPDFVDAGLVIFAALLGLWSVVFGYRKIINLLHWSRSDV